MREERQGWAGRDGIRRPSSHGVELRGRLGRLDLYLRHLELGALQPLAQGGGQHPGRGTALHALQTLVIDAVLDGLKPQLQPRRQVLRRCGRSPLPMHFSVNFNSK